MTLLLITRVLTEEETSELQWACDIFLSLHRAEGFGLWIAECMARRKACVVTNYSGNTDFTNEFKQHSNQVLHALRWLKANIQWVRVVHGLSPI